MVAQCAGRRLTIQQTAHWSTPPLAAPHTAGPPRAIDGALAAGGRPALLCHPLISNAVAEKVPQGEPQQGPPGRRLWQNSISLSP